jgi:hypothetical protein
MNKTLFKTLSLIGLTAMGLTSCSDDDENTTPDSTTTATQTPANYEFTRDGNSTVNYDGQTSRLNQLEELTQELKKADAGAQISSATLLDMFANQNNPFSQAYDKELKSKTFQLDVNYFEDLMTSAANLSGTTDSAFEGKSGLMTRESGVTILVDSNGREFTQLIEKGLMGATFYNQIVNTYLTDDKIGSQVDNSTPVDTAAGKYYTDMEHHFDEAFGYMGFPIDFRSNYTGSGTIRFWGKYSNTADENIQMNDRLMNAFKLGRKAVVDKNYTLLDEQVTILYTELEVMIAATAIHYVNQSITLSNTGDRHHALSECYAFVRALRYSNASNRRVSQMEIDNMLENKIGANFYATTESDLNYIKDELARVFDLESVKDQL